MDVYADLLFLINFFMDLACLKISSRIGSFACSVPRLCIASAIGGIYSIAALFIVGRFLSLLVSLTFCFIIASIAFARRGDKIKRIAEISGIYFGVSTALGGGVSVAFLIIKSFFDSVSGGDDLESALSLTPEKYLSLALGCLITFFAVKLIKKANVDKAERIRISFLSSVLVLELIVDSGNKLREPVSNKACTVISFDDLSGAVGESRALDLVSGKVSSDAGVRICAVPVVTVNGSSLMFGFFPDAAELLDSSGKSIGSVDTVIAVSCEKELSLGRAIFPAELI